MGAININTRFSSFPSPQPRFFPLSLSQGEREVDPGDRAGDGLRFANPSYGLALFVVQASRLRVLFVVQATCLHVLFVVQASRLRVLFVMQASCLRVSSPHARPSSPRTRGSRKQPCFPSPQPSPRGRGRLTQGTVLAMGYVSLTHPTAWPYL